MQNSEMFEVGDLALATSEPAEAQAVMCKMMARHRLRSAPSSREMRVRYHALNLDSLSFHRVSYGAPVIVDVAALEAFYLLQISLNGSSSFLASNTSTAIPQNSIFVVNPDKAFRKEWSADSHQLTVKIDRILLETYFASEFGHDRPRGIAFHQRPISFQTASTLVGFVAVMCAGLVSQRKLVCAPSVSREMTHTLLSLLLNTVPHNGGTERSHRSSPAAPYYVKRAEEFIRASASEEIVLQDIAAAAGVSARALSKGFRRFRDTTPMRFLRETRLDLARRKLLDVSPGAASVTEIAASCGIHHFSRFAQDYFRRFGELPSETLRRQFRMNG
jgi:AraC-like DNA-binding protein